MTPVDCCWLLCQFLLDTVIPMPLMPIERQGACNPSRRLGRRDRCSGACIEREVYQGELSANRSVTTCSMLDLTASLPENQCLLQSTLVTEEAHPRPTPYTPCTRSRPWPTPTALTHHSRAAHDAHQSYQGRWLSRARRAWRDRNRE